MPSQNMCGHVSAPVVNTGGSQAVSREEFDMLKAQLEQARRMATVGELTSTTTHEFNNLLMTILNYAKLGLRYKDEPSRDKALTRILDAANRATKITGSILALARARQGQREPVALKGLIEDSLLLLEREFRKYRIHLELALEEGVPAVLATGSELQRVLLNLLVNARQATPEGGTVRIALTHDRQSGEVLLSVRDTGSGIAADVLPKIFDPFFSTKSGPDATGKGGTGVGLSSCKEVIDSHGGRIRVESSLGKGTAFHIRLPAHTAAANAERAGAAETSPVPSEGA
ncbi:MAG: sensor histidine kinase [Planctomycetales bacterium]|nr:sensor histidine kinase [Planctomycetales bacterium]